MAATPPCSWLLPRWEDSFCEPPGATALVAEPAVAGKGARGNGPQGMRWLWWPEERGPCEGCHGQRACSSAHGAKGERCKAGGPSVQGFGLVVGQQGGKTQTRWPGGSLQDSSNAYQLNIVIADFYTGSCSQFQGKDTLFTASPFPATSPDLLVTCTWLRDGRSVSHPPFFFSAFATSSQITDPQKCPQAVKMG